VLSPLPLRLKHLHRIPRRIVHRYLPHARSLDRIAARAAAGGNRSGQRGVELLRLDDAAPASGRGV